MKKSVLATAMALVVSLGPIHSHAAETVERGKKEMITAGSLGFIGAVAAGPIGLLVGALGGEYLGGELDKADQHETLLSEKATLANEKRNVKNRLASAEKQIQYLQGDLEKERELRAMTAHNLEFQILFHTDNYNLNQQELTRLNELAKFLERNPSLNVRLSGYADPRGAEDYNQALSVGRSENVRKVLEEKGIDPLRIESYAYGAEQSQAIDGDFDAYALERRVTIEVYEPEGSVATAN